MLNKVAITDIMILFFAIYVLILVTPIYQKPNSLSSPAIHFKPRPEICFYYWGKRIAPRLKTL